MSPDDDLDADLRELARSKPGSGRAAQAKASALRTIERLGRPQQEVPLALKAIEDSTIVDSTALEEPRELERSSEHD